MSCIKCKVLLNIYDNKKTYFYHPQYKKKNDFYKNGQNS
jgi:hypothetical protein